ncbi:homeobox protein PKNOX1-like isoform X1 [Oncorhynchus clarkii lewisi]|uniref:homeobox protein PKNOX1-like isoform X1 n=1 Tax=Oncorhynchus clarkii lewisi TaxID=490388 RepID=UPI0039B8CFD7
MMEAHSASLDEYPEVDEVLVQMRVGADVEGDPEQSLSEGGAGSPSAMQPQTPMDTDKQAIYSVNPLHSPVHRRHPLFPLLALLFEKCEQSTQSSDCVSSASFNVDIENFVRSQKKEGKVFFCDDPDVDNLMVKAIQVLRIHLLELEKVSDLCKDFCSRYIACLRTKMNSETLLSGGETDSPCSPVQIQTSSPLTGTLSPQGIVMSASALQQGNVTLTTVNSAGQVLAGMSPWHTTSTGGTVYQPITVVTPQGQVVGQAISPQTIRINNTQLQLQLNQDLSSFFTQEDSSPKSNKRGVLPKSATNIMRTWLFQHIGHPYPTEDEKKQLAIQTNLTLLQVNNWFINARRRILQPMMDSSASDTPKSRKRTPQSRPTQRFWPMANNIASAGVGQEVAMDDDVTMVTMGMSVDELQTLTSDGATLAMQQVMMGGHSEEEEGESEEEEEEEGADMAGLE